MTDAKVDDFRAKVHEILSAAGGIGDASFHDVRVPIHADGLVALYFSLNGRAGHQRWLCLPLTGIDLRKHANDLASFVLKKRSKLKTAWESVPDPNGMPDDELSRWLSERMAA